MRNTRRTFGLIAGAGLAVVALALAACGSGTSASDSATTPAAESPSVESAAGDAADADDEVVGVVAGDAAGIVESGARLPDPDLASRGDTKRKPAQELVTGKSYTPVSATGITFVDPASMTFEFTADGRISILGGCNAQFGDLEWDGEFVAAPVLASTMMACDQPLMDQDYALTQLFTTGFATDVWDGILTLTNPDGTIVLAEQDAGVEPAPLPSTDETAAVGD